MVINGKIREVTEDMGMLKSISLENYKCFEKLKVDDKEELEIAPLTVLCGVNSSGKSSIINSLLMLKQSYESNSTSNNMKINGSYIKAGTFEDISKDRTKQPITFNVTYKLDRPPERYKRKQKISKFDVTAFKTLSKIYPYTYNITRFTIRSHIVIKHEDETLQLKGNILSEQLIELGIYNGSSIITSTSIYLQHIQANQYLITVKNIPNGDNKIIESEVILKGCTCYFENFNLINAYSTNIYPRGTMVDGILANIYLIFRMVALQYKNLHYLTPLRVYPQRNYTLDSENDNVGIGGEFTPHLMYEYSNKKITGFLPPENDILSSATKFDLFSTFINKWMMYLNFGEYSLKKSFETIKLDISNYNISNVGFGISQVLPILVTGLIQNPNETLLLEQPEIHLHPKAQMCIADFLLLMAATKKRVIIETHSDHIINRIVRRCMENSNMHKLTKIYFIDKEDKQPSKIEEIKIDPVDGALCENENFFYQFASETEKIIDAGYKNLEKKRKMQDNVQDTI